MKKFLVFLVFLVLLTGPFFRLIAKESSLKINIISHSLANGAGKEVDVAILKKEFESRGHRVILNDYFKVEHIHHADINIFLAQFKPEWFSKAKLNWFIPNPECCDASKNDIEKFDLVLCKTQETFKIFSSLAKEVFYLGFTSLDRYEPSIRKNYKDFLHVAGKSRMKGSGSVYKVWTKNPSFPLLTMIWHRQMERPLLIPRNMKFINRRISSESLNQLQNHCGFHLCPSITEGFGHYIMEAMSTEAVVITTDAPPMNEFIKDSRCLVKCKRMGKKNFANTYYVDEKALAKTIQSLRKLSDEELKEIGRRNREEFLRRKAEFKQNFEDLIQKTQMEKTR